MPVRADEEKLKEFVIERLGLPPQLLEGEDWDKRLIEQKVVSEEKLLSILSEFYGFPYVDLRNTEILPEIVKIIPRSTAEKFLVIPFEKRGPNLKLAMADPSNIQVRERIRFTTGFKIQPFVALPFRIREKLQEVFGKAEEEFFSKLMSDIEFKPEEKEESQAAPTTVKSQVITLDDLKSLATQAPIVKLVNALILEALQKGASDIHIEPFEKEVRVRYRIDGVLHVVSKYSPEIKDAIVARIKVLSGLDIAEKRLPQDGRMKATFQGRQVDFRVSTVPTIYGEKVVLRILDKGALKLDLSD
ncbi:MAG: type II secretion system protein GspE, partial [Thermovibrio sp.]